MTEEPEGLKCDIDDLLCQMQILTHLRGMKSVLGDEKFKSSFAEFEGLDTTLTEKIQSQETSLREALEKCGLSKEVEEYNLSDETVVVEEESNRGEDTGGMPSTGHTPEY